MVKTIAVDYDDNFKNILGMRITDGDKSFHLDRFVITDEKNQILKTTDEDRLFSDIYKLIERLNIKIKVFEISFFSDDVSDLSYIVDKFSDLFPNIYKDYYLVGDTTIGKRVHDFIIVLFNFSEVERVLNMLKEKKPKMENIIKKLNQIDRKYFLMFEEKDGIF